MLLVLKRKETRKETENTNDSIVYILRVKIKNFRTIFLDKSLVIGRVTAVSFETVERI